MYYSTIMDLENDAEMCSVASDADIADAIAAGLRAAQDAETLFNFLTFIVGVIRHSERIRMKTCS
jgi:hypothetical protein